MPLPSPRPVRAADKIRVLLVDDHKILREALGSLLNSQPDLAVAGEANDGREAIAQARQLKPDVVVMDINMPVLNGIEATRVVTGELPSVRVIGLSMAPDLGATILGAGAASYLARSAAAEQLIAAIRKVARPQRATR
ncbi:MAG: response regulator transcription factor [Verrucomicrobiota bacterium]|nr:response regulator transcription factor [Verrucomicrobiota bacterium]